MPRTRYRILALFSYLTLAWGGSYVAIDAGLAALPPVFFAATRLDIAALIVLPAAVFLTANPLPTSRDALLDVAVSGVLITAGFNVFLYIGQQYTTSAVAAIIISLNPLFASGFAWLLLPRERLGRLGQLGLVVGLVGVGIIVQPTPAAILSGNVGQLIVLLGAASIALGSVVSRRLASGLPSLATTGWGLLLGGVLLHLVSIALGEQVPLRSTWSSSALLAVLFLGVVATAGAYPAFFALLGAIGPVRTNLVSYIIPIVTVLLGWVLLGQSITLGTVGGFLVVLAGFALVNRRTLLETAGRAVSTQTAD